MSLEVNHKSSRLSVSRFYCENRPSSLGSQGQREYDSVSQDLLEFLFKKC